MNSREAAYLSVLRSLQSSQYISESLEQWRLREHPSSVDYQLAQEIAYGTARRALSLDYIATQLSAQQKLNLKLKEKILLRTAVYQAVFMNKIPLYAIVNETVKIAHKYCHSSLANYLNAILRKFSDYTPKMPLGDSAKNFSIQYSYPEYYVNLLINDYGISKAKQILEAGNQPGITMVRVRKTDPTHLYQGLKLISTTPFPIAVVEDPNIIPTLAAYSDYYIQNATQATLIGRLCEQIQSPKNVLDLCAAPGGKLLAVHDKFLEAKLFANDVSPQKLKKLEENCLKYQVSAAITCSDGLAYESLELFDLIILDAPCSNSGVFNKRPEARWRFTPESQEELTAKQMSLIRHAKTLLAAEGEIWYMTCSILKEENEFLMHQASQQHALQIQYMETVLPDLKGRDGGFACRLTNRHLA